MNQRTSSTPKYRHEYRPPNFWIDRTELVFDLYAEYVIVQASLHIRRNGQHHEPLVLDGELLELLAITCNDQALLATDYAVDENQLRIFSVPDQFILHTKVRIFPQRNTQFEGLYLSNGMFCTQCEAEGFRRITYFLDRPDVMCIFSTTVIADQAAYPVLLSNGNRVAYQALEQGRHQARWEDPFAKPAYLFALVAGDLVCHQGKFTTQDKREVSLEIWVEPQNRDKCAFALESLQRAMRWDEQVYGLAYDLDVYMIVAVHDFNMGAMENKGLNIFNAKYVLARPETATDDDYKNIEGVIGHEYFHNWTGNRVTCRDWFQLTLKEGLTVFRDEQFSADMTSAPVKRIEDVKVLRTRQFAEDAGPMAHPIRPESYIEMSNFYTVTVYNKGSEVIRMYHTLLGAAGFRKGMDLYFQRHDGQAVTCDDFRAAMADANGVDLTQFERWYTQHGTVQIEYSEAFDAACGRYSLTLHQNGPLQNNKQAYQPMHIPVRMGLIAEDGSEILLQLAEESAPVGTERVLELRELSTTFTFVGLTHKPVPSLFRHFSAPVQVKTTLQRADTMRLITYDRDPFNRWDAIYTLAGQLLLEQAAAWTQGKPMRMDEDFVAGFGQILADTQLDEALKAQALELPTELMLAQLQRPIIPAALHAARTFMETALARHYHASWQEIYHRLHGQAYCYSKSANAKRRLKNVALYYLTCTGQAVDLARAQFDHADNMTDRETALKALIETAQREEVLDIFYRQWRNEPLMIDKWFQYQAQASHPETFTQVQALTHHEAFSQRNPNRVRALLHYFSHTNPFHFHREDGQGYQLLADYVITLNSDNPQIASRLASALNAWRHYQSPHRQAMRVQLQRIAAQPKLSSDVYEVVMKSLNES